MAESEGPVFMAGEKTITVTGTAEALATANRVKSVTIIAKTGNTGQVYIGRIRCRHHHQRRPRLRGNPFNRSRWLVRPWRHLSRR